MGWHMKLVICVQLAYVSVCLTQLSVVREWTSLDLQLPPGDGQESRRSITPSQVYSWLLYKDRMFVTFYRESKLSLFYLDLTDNSTSPLLRPYPSYENQQSMILYELDKIRVDRCDRLWMIYLVLRNYVYKYFVVFDLKTDSILRNGFIPEHYKFIDMNFDDFDCDNEYVYISDEVGYWKYSWAKADSWQHFLDPVARMFLVPNSFVSHNLKYHPLREHYISSKSFETPDIKELNVNLTLSVLDAKSDVFYYFNNDNRTVIHAVPCWTSERCCSNCQGDIDVGFDPTHELKYITLDENGYLWAVTSRSSFEDGEINFRLLSVPVKSTDVESNANDTTNTTNINESTTPASSTTEQTSTLGSVPKHTTVNIADTTAGTPNSNITQAIGGTNMPYLLFSFANVTFNLSNVTIINFPNNHFH